MRDKVKRFISILMTALMLVNLLPVGALAEGVKISNSVQGIWGKPSANVYVYVKVTGDKAGLTINPSGWYTIGKSANVPGMGIPSSVGPRSFRQVGVWPDTVLDKSRFTRHADNQKIDLDKITWTEFYIDNGADNYVPAGTYTWHMNGTIDIKQLPSVYTIKYVDYDTKELIHSYEVTGLMGQKPEKITAPDSLKENLYSFYFVNGHPKEQTVDFTKDKGELTFYYKKNTAAYTVNYYLNGTKTKVAEPKKGTAALGKSVTESPITVDGYTPVSNDKKSITIGTGTNEINFYYYENVTLTANSDTKTYDGTQKSVSGFTGAPVDADFRNITVGASGTDVGEYPAEFADGTVDTVDGTEKYIVTKAINGTLKITPVTDKVVVTITGHNDTVTYNGSEQSVEGYEVSISAPEGVNYTAADFSFSGTAKAAGTNVGTYPMGLNADHFANTNGNFENVTFNVTDGWLKIDPLSEVVVTITGHNDTVTYNGSEQSVEGYEVSISAPEGVNYTAADFSFSGTAKAAGTNVGTYPMGLNADHFANTNGNFENVTFNVTDGWLKIDPAETEVTVTITGHTGSHTYDGNEKTVTGYDVSIDNELYTENDFTFTGTAEAKGTNAGTYPMGLTADQFANTNGNFTNVTFNVTDGWLKIDPAETEVTVTITGHTGSHTYDGNEKTVTGYDVSIDNELYTENDFTFTGTAEAKGTNAGTYPMGLNDGQFTNNNDNFKKVTFVVNDGKLTINPVDEVVVTITGHNDTVLYDGKEHTVTGYDVSIDNELYKEGDFTFSGSAEAKGTDAGTYQMGLNDGQFTNNNDNFKKVTFVVNDGKLTINPVDEVVVTITGHNDTVLYDGKEHTVTGYDVSIDNELYKEGDFTFSGSAVAKGTDAGTYPMGLEVSYFTNISDNFTNVEFIVTDGYVKINPRPVMLTSANLIKVYDGTPLTNGDAPVKEEFGTEKAFPEGEGVTYTFTGGQTNAGSSKNMFTYAWNEGTNKDNYTIYQIEGDLVVTPIDGIKVTITGHKEAQTYDGKPHKVEGYDVKPDNPLFTEKDIKFNGEAEATGTDAQINPYQMGLKPEQFTNTSNNFTNVEFVVEDGQIVITPRAVTLTSETAGKTYDGTALEKPVVTVGGDGFVEGQVTEIKATGSVTNAGSVANTITFTPNKETFKDGNYAITKTEGTLTIAKRSVLITSQSATKTYDGSALTRPAVTITGDGFVPGELAKAEATGSITKVGSTPNSIQYTTTGAFNAANYSIALSVGTLTVTEKPKPEPRRTFNLTINYVYQNGKRAAASYNRGGLKNGETFDITSPVIAGYTASETVVSGTIYNRDIKVTVIYTADGVNLDDYGVPLGLGNITMNVGDCFE